MSEGTVSFRISVTNGLGEVFGSFTEKQLERARQREANQEQLAAKRWEMFEADIDAVIEDIRAAVDENREMIKKALQVLEDNQEIIKTANERLAG